MKNETIRRTRRAGLSDTAIRAAKPAEKPYRLYDMDGLYIEISPAGGKLWRFKSRCHGKPLLLALGQYPAVSLAGARKQRDQARADLAAGIDPRVRKSASDDNSLEAVSRRWLDARTGLWVSAHAERIRNRLVKDVFPFIGARPVSELTPMEILSALKRIESRGSIETAHRVRQTLTQILSYAIANGLATQNAARDIAGALKPFKSEHFAAAIEPKVVGHILRTIDAYQAYSMIVSAALRLAPLLFVRPGELRTMKWADIDFERRQWAFTTSKTGTRLIVPLARQSLGILEEIRSLTGSDPCVFPGQRHNGRPMSENALRAALLSLGVTSDQHTIHGWRATARTLLAEELGFRGELIELQLGHRLPDPLAGAYHRATYLDERTAMMQRWADYLDELRASAPAIPAN